MINKTSEYINEIEKQAGLPGVIPATIATTTIGAGLGAMNADKNRDPQNSYKQNKAQALSSIATGAGAGLAAGAVAYPLLRKGIKSIGRDALKDGSALKSSAKTGATALKSGAKTGATTLKNSVKTNFSSFKSKFASVKKKGEMDCPTDEEIKRETGLSRDDREKEKENPYIEKIRYKAFEKTAKIYLAPELEKNLMYRAKGALGGAALGFAGSIAKNRYLTPDASKEDRRKDMKKYTLAGLTAGAAKGNEAYKDELLKPYTDAIGNTVFGNAAKAYGGIKSGVGKAVNKVGLNNLFNKKASEDDSYMKDTVCENCGYAGKMNSDDGRCPKCGAMAGQKPVVKINKNPADLKDMIDNSDQTYDEIINSKTEYLDYY